MTRYIQDEPTAQSAGRPDGQHCAGSNELRAAQHQGKVDMNSDERRHGTGRHHRQKTMHTPPHRSRRASRSDSSSERMSPSRTGPFTFRMISRFWSVARAEGSAAVRWAAGRSLQHSTAEGSRVWERTIQELDADLRHLAARAGAADNLHDDGKLDGRVLGRKASGQPLGFGNQDRRCRPALGQRA